MPRPLAELAGVADIDGASRTAFLPDTNIYINDSRGLLPDAARALLDRGLVFHASVALAELAVGIANADPDRAGWSTMREHYTRLFEAIPSHRVLTPDADIWIAAGLIAGTLARTQGFQPHQRKQCLNDALIYLTAARAGIPALTADRSDFDLIQQVAGEGHFIHC